MLENRTYGTAANDKNTLPALTRYIYSNHLQSASLELDENAEIISYEEYHAYGTSSYQAKSNTINAVAKRYKYTGKERDEESGLYYHGARYYVPWLCRWCASDPLESKYAGMSPYNYSFNNPVMFNDPSGMKGEGTMTVNSASFSAFSSVPTVDNTNVDQRPRLSAIDNPASYDLSDRPTNTAAPPFVSTDYMAVWWNSLSKSERYEQARLSAIQMENYDPQILVADIYGVGHIGRASVVIPIVNDIQQEYRNQVFENIRGGPAGALGYWIGGEEATFKWAVIDQISLGLHFSPAMGSAKKGGETNFGAKIEAIPEGKSFETSKNFVEIPSEIIRSSRETINRIRKDDQISNKKNIAYLFGELEGEGIKIIGASGTYSKDSHAGIPKVRYFSTFDVGFDRSLDSEMKILEDFANKYHATPNIKGTLYLVSERHFCPNCFSAVNQFQAMFKNITLIIHSPGKQKK